jgi:hypothetical protein
MQATIQRILSLSSDVRYVAIYHQGRLASATRPDLTSPSSSESDKYEELLVNPTILKLLTQRGNIDCGGLEYVLIRYGSFYEFVASIKDGHVSVGLEPSANPLALVPQIAIAVSGLESEPGAV